MTTSKVATDYTGWRRAMAAANLAMFFTSVGTFATIVYLPLVLVQRSVDRVPIWTGRIEWTLHVSTILMIPFWSRVVERIGGVRALLIGNTVMALSYAAVSRQEAPLAFLALYVVVGASFAILPSCPAVIVKSLPQMQIPRGLGLLQLVTVAALVVGPLVAGRLTAAGKYADVYLLAEAAVMVAAISAAAIGWRVSDHDVTAQRKQQSGTWRDVTAIPHVARLFLILFIVFLATWGSLAPTSLFLLEICKGGPDEVSAWAGVAAAAFSAGLILPLPWLQALAGPRATLSIKGVLLLGAVTTAALCIVNNPALLTILRFAQGLTLAAASPLAFDILQARAPHAVKARAIGLGQAAGRLGVGCGSAAAGAIASWSGMGMYFALSAALLVAAFIAVPPSTHHR